MTAEPRLLPATQGSLETNLPRLILYGTAGCHLCEEAAAILRKTLAGASGNPEWEQTDIAQTPELLARYGVRIPVLYCPDSGAELGWPFDGERLAAFLEEIRPPTPD